MCCRNAFISILPLRDGAGVRRCLCRTWRKLIYNFVTAYLLSGRACVTTLERVGAGWGLEWGCRVAFKPLVSDQQNTNISNG